MKRLTHVEHFENCKAVSLYLVRNDDQEQSEFEKFIDSYSTSNQRDMQVILTWLDRIRNEGAFERRFRPEGKGTSAIPVEAAKLRLYCIRLTDNILILGGGGKKKQ